MDTAEARRSVRTEPVGNNAAASDRTGRVDHLISVSTRDSATPGVWSQPGLTRRSHGHARCFERVFLSCVGTCARSCLSVHYTQIATLTAATSHRFPSSPDGLIPSSDHQAQNAVAGNSILIESADCGACGADKIRSACRTAVQSYRLCGTGRTDERLCRLPRTGSPVAAARVRAPGSNPLYPFEASIELVAGKDQGRGATVRAMMGVLAQLAM